MPRVPGHTPGLQYGEILCLPKLNRCVSLHTMSSREIIRLLKDDGWEETRTKGSHHQFKHPLKSGVVTVPHPKKDLPVGTARAILKSAGINQS